MLPIGLVGWAVWQFSLDTMLGSSTALIGLGVSAVGLAVIVSRLIRTAYRLHGSRRSITDSPLALVRDLIAFEEGRLRRTSPRAVTTAVGVCALYAAYAGYSRHDHPRQLALALAMSLAMAVYLVIASRRISRRAGAELETLHRLHDELSADA
jgi:hypothetical protein